MASDHSSHSHVPSSSRTLGLAVGLTLGFAAVEAVTGWLANSLALLGDAGHMLSDSTALAMGALAAWISRRPPSRWHSFGLQRAEVVGALANGVLMLAVIAWIVHEALARLQDPQPVASWGVIGVATVGLVVNLLVMRILHGGEQTLNTRGALLHVMGDLLGSLAALASGVTIALTGWTPVDPLLSMVISVLILLSTVRLLAEGLHVVMEGVPRHIDLPEVGRTLAGIDGIEEVHDLHIWTLASGSYSLSAHVRVDTLSNWPEQLAEIERVMTQRYGVDHITVQPELAPEIYTVPLSRIQGPRNARNGETDPAAQ